MSAKSYTENDKQHRLVVDLSEISLKKVKSIQDSEQLMFNTEAKHFYVEHAFQRAVNKGLVLSKSF